MRYAPAGAGTSFSIPNTVTAIDRHAFSYCSNLVSVIIPNTATTIEDDAFYKSTKLATIRMPNTVTNIERFAFDTCSALTTVLYGGTEQQWKEINFTSGNKALTNANIIFEYGTAPAIIKDVSCRYDSDSGKITANVDFSIC